jgi:hypothetical protein
MCSPGQAFHAHMAGQAWGTRATTGLAGTTKRESTSCLHCCSSSGSVGPWGGGVLVWALAARGLCLQSLLAWAQKQLMACASFLPGCLGTSRCLCHSRLRVLPTGLVTGPCVVCCVARMRVAWLLSCWTAGSATLPNAASFRTGVLVCGTQKDTI